MAEAEEYAGGDEDVAAAEQEEDVDEELETMKQRLKEMEDETNKLTAPAEGSEEAKDMRSVFVGGVDFSAKPEELQAHFASCGTMDRVTILCDKYTGHPKGYAYIEFAEVESIELALKFNDTEFKGRPLKVTEKRKNVPGRGRGRGGRGGRGRGFRGRGRRGGRGFRAPRYHPYGGGY